jgi:hypothetical protein
MTRQAPDNSPLSQERYMSSPEYAELRGVSGTAVAARAAILDDPEKRRLIWWLQAKSLEPGGLKQIARDLLAQYPDRLGTRTMHKLGVKLGKTFKGEALKKIHKELGRHIPSLFDLLEDGKPNPYDEKTGEAETVEKLLEACRQKAQLDYSDSSLEKFLYDLCVNPRRALLRKGDEEAEYKSYKARLRDRFEEISEHEFRGADVPYFQDVVGALLDYQSRQVAMVRENFVLTAIGKKVWETLDFALKTGRMVLVEGWEGRGKSEAAKAWVKIHQGEARFISLKGVTNKTTFFREIAKSLGIASSYARTATEMQARVEDVLIRSKLMLVLDEFHFAFPQSARIYSRPEIIDWIDTALCNHDVPVGCVTTPQFISCVQRAADQVGWNWRQFRRRVRRWVQLPEWNTQSDLESVAKKLMPGISHAGIKLAVGYAQLSLQGAPSRDVSGLGDVATEARLLAENGGRSAVTFQDVDRAINEYLAPSDSAFADRMVQSARKRASRRVPVTAIPQRQIEEPEKSTFASNGREIAPTGDGIQGESSRLTKSSLTIH